MESSGSRPPAMARACSFNAANSSSTRATTSPKETRMATYLIVGASGNVGSNIVQELAAQGHNVRATTSRKEAVGKRGNVETVILNAATGEGVAAAFKGVDGAFFLA